MLNKRLGRGNPALSEVEEAKGAMKKISFKRRGGKLEKMRKY